MEVGLRRTLFVAGVTAVAVGLFALSRYQFVFFHTFVELVSILVASGIFVLAWNTRGIHTDGYLLILGVAYLSVAGIDLLHTLSYEGMEVFAGYGSNLPTQLWIAARGIESVTLLLAPAFMRRTLRSSVLAGIYVLVTGGLIASIFIGWFPQCYVEGVGLTLFKRVAEIAISLVLVGALAALYRKRSGLERPVFLWLAGSIVLTIGSEVAFSMYVDVFGTANAIGHILKLLSFYFIYCAIIRTGLVRPVTLLFRDLKEKEESLREAQRQLEQRVKERTEELLEANRRLGLEIDERIQAESALRTSKGKLQQLTRRLVLAQEEERLRLSRELHDEAGQALTALRVSLGLAAADSVDCKAREQIEQASRLAEDTLERLRSLAHALRPAALDALGINRAVDELVQDFSRQTGLKVEHEIASVSDIPDEISVSVYRILQEALTNITRHARAEHVHVLLERNGPMLCLTVQDDGLGFDSSKGEEPGNGNSGQGLLGVRERLALIGGELCIESKSGRGTSLRACFPLEARE